MKAIATSYDDAASNVVPLLGASEEAALCRRWHERPDVAAAEQLIGGHLHPVARVAAGHRGYGMLRHELIAEGHLGLMYAACQ